MSNNRNEKIILILIILTILFTIMGGSLAYLSWVSSDAQKTNVTFATGVDFSCSADGGGNITEDDAILVPTEVNNDTTENYIKREIKVTPTITGKNLNILMDLWLDINKLDSGLSTSENVKYALTTSSTSNSEGVVTTGTFHGMKANEKINLLSDEIYSITTTNTYYLWIWIDAAQTTLETAGQTFNLSLNGSCSMAASIVGNTLSKINNYNNDSVEVLLSNPYDRDIETTVSYEDEILKDDITVPAETEEMSVEVYVTESVIRKAINSTTNYLTVTVLDNGRETKYNTNVGFTKTVHYLHSGSNSSTDFFGQTFDKSTIKSITFVDNNNVPSDAVGSMDVSSDSSGSIMAWYYKASDYTDDNELYDFYIGSSDGLVYAPSNSNFLFTSMKNVVTFDFAKFDTSNTTSMNSMFAYCASVVNLDLSSFNTSKVSDLSGSFRNMSKLQTINLSSFKTSNVTSLQSTFENNTSLIELDLSNWNTEKLTSMHDTFSSCKSLKKLNLTGWKTPKLVNMYMTFRNCSSLISLDLSSFDTSNVTTMDMLFSSCSSLQSLNLSNWNTEKVANMYSMFSDCTSLTSLDLTSFNVKSITSGNIFSFDNCTALKTVKFGKNLNFSGVTTMTKMFYNCSSLEELDLSMFDTSSVTSLANTFERCSNLKTLNLSGWNTENVTTMSQTFRDCPNLQELNLSSFKTPKVTTMWGMFIGDTNLKKVNMSNVTFIENVSIGGMFKNATGIEEIDLRNADFTIASVDTTGTYPTFGYSNSGGPKADAKIIVKDATQKEWFNEKVPRFTNIVIAS